MIRFFVIALFALAGANAAAAGDFGAIAVDPGSNSYGYSAGAGDRLEAEGVALYECLVEGEDCEVAVWFENGCGALAISGDGSWGSGWGDTVGIARENAEGVCYDEGGDSCVIELAFCTWD